ncbi:MAG: hypothetical protein R3D53_08950 [Paracoccaceae bacterium]
MSTALPHERQSRPARLAADPEESGPYPSIGTAEPKLVSVSGIGHLLGEEPGVAVILLRQVQAKEQHDVLATKTDE